MFQTTWRSAQRNGKVEGTERRAQLSRWHRSSATACNWLSHGPSQLFLHPQRRIPIDELSDVSQATYTRYADKVTNKMSNSLAQKPGRHHVSPPDALLSPSSPTLPGSQILIGSHSEESPMAENGVPLWTGEKLTNQRTSFAEHLARTAN